MVTCGLFIQRIVALRAVADFHWFDNWLRGVIYTAEVFFAVLQVTSYNADL